MVDRSRANRVCWGAWLLGVMVLNVSGAQDGDVQVDGLVVARQKYSFTLRALDRDYRVVVPNGTPLLMKLTMPEIDFSQHELSVELLVSASDGDPHNNVRVTRPLEDALYLSTASEAAASPAASAESGVQLVHAFVLSPRPTPQPASALHGQLLPGDQPGRYKLQVNPQPIQVQLGPRRGLLAHASLMDLEPNATEVFVDGRIEGDAVVARRIRFQPVGDPFARFVPGLPNVLVIGDQTSLNYDRALRELLAGKANVHHPPCNCGGSENWQSLHRWLANPDGKARRWDVIVFNFGLQDRSTTQADYTENLRRVLELLQPTDAQLVWVTTIPEPAGTADANAAETSAAKPGWTQERNEWAAAVLARDSRITSCDLWQVVQDHRSDVLQKWWAGSKVAFDYDESKPLAEAVAAAILRAAAVDASTQAGQNGPSPR